MRTTAALATLAACCLLLGCDQQQSATGTAEPIENDALGLRFTGLPQECEVVANEGPELTFDCLLTDRGTHGTVHVEVGEVERSINLLEMAQNQKGDFEDRPAGEFKGNRELVTPGGPAYTARGRYERDGEDIEETRVLTLHPTQNRPLVLRFVYPEGDDTTARIDQLFSVLVELEGVGTAAGADQDGESAKAPTTPSSPSTPSAEVDDSS